MRTERLLTRKKFANNLMDKICAICYGGMGVRDGRALLTAECSHIFHVNCIANNVKHGNQICPTCRSTWKNLPFNPPGANPLDPIYETLPPHRPIHSTPWYEPDHFSDDEPLLQNENSSNSSSQVLSSTHKLVTIRGFPEFRAVAASDSVLTFSVLVGLQASTLTEGARHQARAPVDLIVLLDVSGSMMGTKLTLLKRAVCFVIENLGPADRLSIVSFASRARRIFPLRRMSDTGRDGAIHAVGSLIASGGTNIVEGLTKSVKVLEERRERNPVASIMLLSDGQDNFRKSFDIDQFLPPSICPANRGDAGEGLPPIPVHTFGIGSDHDSALMHKISDVSGGTFSFIQDENIIQDAFARCIGGLLSVVAQRLRLTMTSMSSGVVISLVSSGKYSHEISSSGESGVINVGDIYAGEEKDFLVQLSVPIFVAVEDKGEINPTTQLLKVECSYDTSTKENVDVETLKVNISRPQTLSSEDRVVCLEVDRQRNRLLVAESIAKAQKMAESGNLASAQTVLENRRLSLLSSSAAQAGDGLCKQLGDELMETKDRMRSHDVYEASGRAYAFSGMSSHSRQRATTRGDNSNTHAMYGTHMMASMVKKSQAHPKEVP